jgi:murein DD-endopeptidase MepM/ murein hydrolase activator NlpD
MASSHAKAQAPVAPMRRWLVTQPFGCTGVSFEPASHGCAHFHSGIDLAAPAGAEVYAVLDGVASVAGPTGPGGGYGLHVTLRHGGGLASLYAHLDAVAVESGQAVRAGDLIGFEGSTGLSSGPHLHFEVRRDGVAADPVLEFPSLFASDVDNRHNPARSARVTNSPGEGQQ